mgnify:CR=1 FL=1
MDRLESPPKISVVMPVYNTEKYVSGAIESILGQTYKDFELIMINDGSTDGSLSIMEKYSRADPRIRLAGRKERQGVAVSLNEGLAMARGEYIARMDADDISLPERFEKQIAFLEEHPDIAVVGSSILVIDPEGLPLTPCILPPTHEEIDRDLMKYLMKRRMYHPTMMMRRSVLAAAGGYRKEFAAEDYDLLLRLVEVCKVANLPEVLLKYREHFSSVGATAYNKEHDSTFEALRQAYERRGLKFEGIPPRDIDPESMTKAGRYRAWFWWALNAGNRKTARKYLFKTLASRPFSKETVTMFFCYARNELLHRFGKMSH